MFHFANLEIDRIEKNRGGSEHYSFFTFDLKKVSFPLVREAISLDYFVLTISNS